MITPTSSGRGRKSVIDALNGDYDAVEPALRRALIALATELDDCSDRMEQEHVEIRSIVSRIQALLITAILSVLTTVITAIVVNAIV